MRLVRNIGFSIIAVAAVAIWFLLAPDQRQPEGIGINLSALDYVDMVEQALSDFDLNEAVADSAPQQQVVAGWVARDLLSVIALAQADQLEALGGLVDQNETVASAIAVRDDRIPALLGLVVLAMCWHGAISPAVQPVRDTEDPRLPAAGGDVGPPPSEPEY